VNSLPDIHEVYAVRYAHHDRPKHENYIGGDPHDTNEPLAYFVWVIKGPHGTFVMDTGFDPAMAAKRGRTIVKPVAEGLRAIDVDAEQVTDVIISHLHYDHSGNHDLFPRARYHLQDREMAYGTGRCMCHAHQRIPFEVDDVVAMVRKVFDGRVVFHDGVDSLVLVEPDETSGEERVYVRSGGALRVARYLGGPWHLARALAVVPRFLRDWAYDGFARIRYRVFGRYESCPIPSPEQRARFID